MTQSDLNQNRGLRLAPPALGVPALSPVGARPAGPAVVPSDVIGSLLRILPDAVIGLDRFDLVTHWNEAAERTYGISAAEAIGRRWSDLVDTVHAEGDASTARRQLQVQGRWQGLVRQVSRSGKVVEIESTVAALYDQAGGPRGVVAVNRELGPGGSGASDDTDLTHRATHDSLTGLPNRTVLMEELASSLIWLEAGTATGVGAGAGGPGQRRRLAVLFCDLDGFKDINDGLGHAVGDQVLVAVAQRLRRRCRSADLVARFGGDEFVVVMAVDGVNDAIAMATRIIEVLDTPIVIGDAEVSPGVSVGITVADTVPAGDDPVASLLHDADTAMYHAKGRGRGRYELFDANLRDNVEERLELATAMRRAVGDGELELVYQSRRTCGDRRVTGVEALLRWRHPELGVLGPEVFLSIAERTGRIVELGDWVLRQSLADLAELPDPQLALAVNVSAKQLVSGRLTRSVARALAESGVAPERLVLEVTETAFSDDPAAARRVLHELKALGVVIALDDFGTGWSSLQYLCGLPVDVLKVDRSFVADLPAGTAAGAVVSSVLGLGHGMGLLVVAEGVETPTTLDLLRRMGCDEYQGFIDGEPGDLIDILRR
ncbi:EAL domain-containing protein [Kineosporia sp. J2-2]|uniref:EAL domain-containing protein n=1 Tax=Kineosporia corallincola TaxID=2835133 RepID=A0ABS5TTG1_9ACTN|nr:EAL domain-containing protein [Kineosporia corallincola]MBT0774050.1 EAL domain-containing protein [Kineosporia corallincola]